MASTTFVDGETLIEASWLNDVNAAVYTPGTQTAADIANVPAGNIAATNVQTALNELDTEKQPVDALLTAIAAQTTVANNVQAYSGADTPLLLSTGISSGNIPLIGTKSATETLAGLVELATQAEAETGTDNTVVPTTLRVAQAIKSWTIRTSDITPLPSAGGAVSVAHTIGYIPTSANLELCCLVSEGGYSIGTVVEATGERAGSGFASPLTIWKTPLSIGFTMSAGESLVLRNPSTGVAFTPTAANWAYRFVLVK